MNLKELHLPLTDIEKDKLNFSIRAEEIANFISNYPSNIPYAISIKGSWGSGKSTMLNFIEEKVNKNTCKVIRFNPWMVSDSELLIKSLFEEIYFAIDNGFTRAKKTFAEYAQKIIPPSTRIVSYLGSMQYGTDPRTSQAVSQSASEVAKELSNSLFNIPLSKTRLKVKEELNTMFVENGKKVVIMIDELDRLFPDEVITIFQMIKSTLDLPGIFFVVAMDNNVIFDSLEYVKIKNPDKYLQKIFQRSYLINSSFQIKTLAKEYLLNELALFKELEKEDFVFLVNTFIFLEKENFYKVTDKLNVNGMDIESRQKKVNSKYHNVYRCLREEYENPRHFIKLCDYLIDKFPTFHKEFFLNKDLSNNYKQIFFLVIICYFKYPEFVDDEFVYLNLGKDMNYPKLITNSKNLIDDLLPKKSDYSGTENKLLMKIIVYLNGFPDIGTDETDLIIFS